MYGLAADGDFGGEYTGGAPAGAGQQPAGITQAAPAGPVFYDYTTERVYRNESIAPRPGEGQILAGVSNSTLAIGVGVAVLALAFVKGRR